MTTRSRQRNRRTINKIPIIVADSQVLFRKGIQRMLAQEEDIDILGDTGEVKETLSQIENLSPRVVMLDANLTPQHPLDLAETIHRCHPIVSVILMAQRISEQQIFQAMKAGVAAPLSRDASVEEIVSVIRNVSKGGMPMVEDLLHRPAIAALIQEEFLLLRMVDEVPPPLIAPLADKESEILALLAKGHSAEEVAAAMNMDQKSLQNALSSILIKLANNKQTLDTVATRFQAP